MLSRESSLTLNPLSTDVTEVNDQVPSPENPATEEVQEQTPIVAQVEGEEVAVASETDNNISNSNGQTVITASDDGLSKGCNFILFASYFSS